MILLTFEKGGGAQYKSKVGGARAKFPAFERDTD